MDLFIVLLSSLVIPTVVLVAIVMLHRRVLQKQAERDKRFLTIINEKERVQTSMEKVIETKNQTIKNLKSFIYED